MVALHWAPVFSGAFLVSSYKLSLNAEKTTNILLFGITKGLFSGKKLNDYFVGTKEDWANARQIINCRDKAQLIAGYGRTFYSAISYRPV